MRVYTVHLPPPYSQRDREPVVIYEGFSPWAFLFSGLWAFWHRMWLVGIAVILGTGALGAVLDALGAGELAQTVVMLAVAVWIGGAANDWRRWHLARKGWKDAAVIAAPDHDAALRRYADLAALDGLRTVAPPAATPAAAPSAGSPFAGRAATSS